METVTNELSSNGELYAGLASLAGTLVAFALMAVKDKIKAYVLKTENKLDDAIYKGIESAVSRAVGKAIKSPKKKSKK